MSNFRERVETVKSRINLRHFIASQGLATDAHHARSNGRGRRDVYHSPAGGDSTPSFMVDDRGWVDYHAGITFSHDAMDFLTKYRGMTAVQALEVLERYTGSEPQQIVRPPDVFKSEAPAYDEAKATKIANYGYDNVGAALSYLEKRGINRDSAHKFRLGLMDWTYKYESKFGLIEFAAKRVTIPYLATTKKGQFVREVNARCHLPSCLKAWADLQARSPEIAQSIVDDLLAQGYTYGTMNTALFKHVFAPRYMRFGYNTHLFNADALIKESPEGKPVLKKLSQLAIVEGEFDAILLTQLGFPTVAIPQRSSLPIDKLFANVKQVYIPFDSDEAGQNRLETWRDAIGREKTIPIGMKHAHIKDVTEFWQDLGEKALIKHIESFGMLRA